jgi:hypothetical protein
MKRVLFTLLIFCSLCVNAQNYWVLKPKPTTRLLTRIQFVDTLFGWAGGDSGTVIHTTNGGLNWTIQNTQITGYPIEDLYFLNRRLGWGISNDYLFN